LTLTTGSPFPFDTLPVAEEGVTLVGDTFVVPVEGKYQLSALLSLTGLASANPGTITFFAEINSSNTTILGRGTWQSTTAATLSIAISKVFTLAAGDSIGISVGSATNMTSASAIGSGESWMQIVYQS
jgi:hypothetical protein